MSKSERDISVAMAERMSLERLRIIIETRAKDIVVVSMNKDIDGDPVIQLDGIAPFASYNGPGIQVITIEAQEHMEAVK